MGVRRGQAQMPPMQIAFSTLLGWNSVERAEFSLGFTIGVSVVVIIFCLLWRSSKKEREKREKMRAELAARKLQKNNAAT